MHAPAPALALDTGDPGQRADGYGRDLLEFQLHEGDVYAERVVVYADGELERHQLGSLQLHSGSEVIGHIDPRDGRSPDGNVYLFRAAAWQDAEDGPVIYETRVARGPELPPEEAPDPIDQQLRDAPEPAFLEWVASSDPRDVRRVTVNLPDFPELLLPRVPHPDTVPPDYYLQAQEARAAAIQAREAMLAERQKAAITALLGEGGTHLGSAWLNGELFVEGPPTVIRPWVEVHNLRSGTLHEVPTPSANDGLAIRTSTQVGQYFVNGYDGRQPTGRNGSGRVLIGFFDRCFDLDHPAWLDCQGCNSRLVAYLRYNSGFGMWLPVTASDVECSHHATRVIGMAVGDLMENQDPSFPLHMPQRQRTGTSREAKFFLWDYHSGTPSGRVGQAIAQGVDVINMSGAWTTGTCTRSTTTYNAPVSDAYLDGIFWVQSPGNGTDFSVCNYDQPGGAAGAFTVNALSINPGVDLQSGAVGSGRLGGGPFDRNVIAMLAPGGRETATLPTYDDAYVNQPAATSFAVPMVSGAAADLRGFLSIHHASWSLDAGYMQALMTLMGDGQTGPQSGTGPKANSTYGLDPIWGAGRLRMRMFNDVGMDFPWRVEAQQAVIFTGQTITVGANRTGPGGANEVIPITADRLIASLWWYEPNNTAGTIATIHARTCLAGAPSCSAWNPQRERQRYRQMALAGGGLYSFEIEAVTAPTGATGEIPNFAARKVTLAWYYEDNARDDADGPGAHIQ